MPRPLKRGILGASTIILSKILINKLLLVVQIPMKKMLPGLRPPEVEEVI